MLGHLFKLTWLEIKIFLREPMGAIGTVLFPVVLFAVLGKLRRPGSDSASTFARDLPVLITIFIAIGGVTSLVAIVSIYREGGILKRLKATPLQPLTILATHVVVKILFTLITLGFLVAFGRRLYSGPVPPNPILFLLGVLLATVSILSIGFVIASVVPTARFAQPLASMLLYPLIMVSGLFFPLDILPGAWGTIAQISPLVHAVDLLRGLWLGEALSQLWVAVAVLTGNLVIWSAISARVFRWE